MKRYIIFAFLLVWVQLGAQSEETLIGTGKLDTLPYRLQHWEDYFKKHFFDQGMDIKDFRKGSSFMPYYRNRYFYDLRFDLHAQVGMQKRWNVFLKLREQQLESRDMRPVAKWNNIGPNKMDGHAGRMISHAFDPEDSNIIWAGSASGGLWKTENGGELWKPVTDQIPSTGVGAVAVNPKNTNELLIGTGEGYTAGHYFIRPGLGVFKSSDKGLTWQATNFAYNSGLNVAAFKIIWNYDDPNIVWLGATNGIWKSIDGGETWIIKYGNGTNQSSFICNDMTQHPTDPSILYASIEGVGIFKSRDAGESWNQLTNGLPSNDINFISFDLSKSQPDVLYTSIASGPQSGFNLRGIYKTENGGESWIRIPNTPDPFCNAGTIQFGCQGWYDNTIAISPINPDLVIVGGISLWRTADGGQTWTQHDRTSCSGCIKTEICKTYVDQHDLGFDPQNPKVVYLFNDGGISRSANEGRCWLSKNEGLITAQFFRIASGKSNPNVVIGGFQDHGLQGVDLSNGDAWSRWGFLDGVDVEVHPTNENILYGTWIDGTYWKSVGGVTQLSTQITNGINLSENAGFNNAPLRVSPVNGDLLLGCTNAKIYKSSNGGALWKAVANVPNVKQLAFSQVDPKICYAAAYSNTAWSFYRSEDEGETWSITATSPGWRVTDIKTSGLDAGTVYASRNSAFPNNPRVYKSTDFGETWIGIQGNLPDITVNAIAVDLFNESVVYAATDLGIFITKDDGITWTEFNDGFPVSIVSDIEFNPADTMLRVGTIGRGAWVSPAYNPSSVTSTEQLKEDLELALTIYPNPASDLMNIQLDFNKVQDLKIEVINSTGQYIASLLDKKQNSYLENEILQWNGKNSNGQSIPNGVYYLRIQYNDHVFTKPFIWHQ